MAQNEAGRSEQCEAIHVYGTGNVQGLARNEGRAVDTVDVFYCEANRENNISCERRSTTKSELKELGLSSIEVQQDRSRGSGQGAVRRS